MKHKEMNTWQRTEKSKYGVVIYNFEGKVARGLRLAIGDSVQIYEECAGWYRGCLLRNKSQKGIFPSSYVYLKECDVENAGTVYEVVIPKEDPTVKELTSVLREWSVIWKQVYIKNDMQLFIALRKIMWDLVEFRQQLLSGTLTQDQMFEIKQKAINDIDWANSKMGLDLIPRINGEVLDADSPKTSVVELYKVHVDSAKASESALGRGTLKKVKKQPMRTITSHLLYFNMNSFICNVDETCQVFFSIYDATKNKFISERFMVSIGKNDSNLKVNEFHKISNSTCIFTDLGENDLHSNCYLVAQLIRVGKMIPDSSNRKVSNASYRRPYGCAVVDIVDILKEKEEMADNELYMSIQLLSGGNETDFVSIHENIIKKLQSKYGAPESDFGIYVSVRMLHGELEKLQLENPLLLPQGIAIVRKVGFPEIIMPGDIRNDVYVTIESGEFERGPGKTSQKNVEVCMCVVGSHGRLFEDCIYIGGGAKPCTEYQSMIYYHNGSPKWNETIKVQIPFDKFYGAHLRFGFRHLAKFEDKDKEAKTFAFSFFKLMGEDGTTVRDKSHELCLYKFERNTYYDSKAYINMASMASDIGKLKNVQPERVARCTKETFVIHTVVCSTKLTQNVDLVGLLRWREQKHQLQLVLQSLFKINGEEIVKFLQDIFDALFWILNESILEYAKPVFEALVYIIWILSSKKYHHFQAVLTTYIEKHFSGITAHRELVSCLTQALVQTGDSTSIEHLKKTMTAFEYIFKFIIKSKVLFTNTFGNKEEDTFKRELLSLFKAFNNLISQQTADLVPAQSLALRNFAGIYNDALMVFTRVELSGIITEFVNSVDPKSKALICPKLQCISQTVQSELFVHEDSRQVLIPMIVGHLHYHLSQKQEMKTCADILGPVLTALQTKAEGNKDEDVYLVVKSLLQTVFLTVKTVDRAGTLSRHLLAILINLLRIMKEDHYGRFLQQFDTRRELRDFLFNAFVVFTEMIKRQSFPGDWVVIIMLANNVILTAIQNFSIALCDQFCDENFDSKLWNSYFQLSVAFLIQPHLQLENFTEVKRNKIIDRYGDMRQVMGFEIGDMWRNLGENKKNFIPSLIGPFLEMTLVPETELRKATLPIFFDMMECELLSKGFIQMVENEIVNKLDKLVSYKQKGEDVQKKRDSRRKNDSVSSKKKGDEEYKELFHEILTEKVKADLQDDFKEEGLRFVNRVTDLLKLLLDYRSCIHDDNTIRRLSCIVNLLEFYRGIDREDMFIRYINRLCELHIPAENFTEAGFALLLHAELLTWSEIPIDDKSPITERQLKEKLYLDAINYFDKGKCWEKGIELCKELAELYEKDMYDFVKLSDILKFEATFYDKIMTKIRPEPEYFRVGMFGKGFPTSLRNKEFVYRGNEFEKIGAFNSRMQAHFPDAQIMDKLTPPDDTILQSTGQYIQTCRVTPICEYDDMFRDRTVDERIIRVNHVKRFLYNRPFYRGVANKSNEFANLWLERTTISVSTSLPGILKWFPVVSTSTEEISPIRNAVETVVQKNHQMRSLINRLSTEPQQNINPLSMTLNGVIDAAVMGGTAKYQDAFFSEVYILSNPDDQEFVIMLDDAITKQVYILEDGLDLHERLLTRALVPFHEKMTHQFARMKADVTGEPYEEPQPVQLPTPLVPEESPIKAKDRKLSLPLRKSSSPATIRRPTPSESGSDSSRHSLWYDGSSPSPNTPSPSALNHRKTLGGSMSSLASSRASVSSFGGSMSSLSGSVASLNTVPEVDEDAPPIPQKHQRPPSDPTVDQMGLEIPLAVKHQHGRHSLPATMMSYRIDRTSDRNDSSPVLPKKQRASTLTADNDGVPDAPPPLPPRKSLLFESASSGSLSNSDDESVTPVASPVPELPPKTRHSFNFSEDFGSESAHSNTEFPIPLPKKLSSTSSSHSSLSPPNLSLKLNKDFPPLDHVVMRRKDNYDILKSPDSDEGSVFSARSSTASEISRASIASSEDSLTPSSQSGYSPTPTSTSMKFMYDKIPQTDSQKRLDLITFSPEEESDDPLSRIPSNSESTKDKNLLNSFENSSQNPVPSSGKQTELGNGNNNWEHFSNNHETSSSFSRPLKSWAMSSTTNITQTKVVNGKTVSSISTESSFSTCSGPSRTTTSVSNARPASAMLSSQSDPNVFALMSQLASSLGERRMTSLEGKTRPTPLPRRLTVDRKSSSTPVLAKSAVSNLGEEKPQSPPTVKPRHIARPLSPEPPPRPPKSPAKPPIPKPYGVEPN